MLRNMVTSLLKHEQIETTGAKAKAVRPVAEKMITLAKRGDLHARRQALSYIQDKTVAHRLFDELKDRYLDRQGGYVRIVKKGARKGDGAEISVIQLLPVEAGKKKPKKPKRSKSKDTKAKKKVETRKDTEKAEKKSRKKPSAAEKGKGKSVQQEKKASQEGGTN
jgi:large subunit ribosomal protein L17